MTPMRPDPDCNCPRCRFPKIANEQLSSYSHSRYGNDTEDFERLVIWIVHRSHEAIMLGVKK